MPTSRLFQLSAIVSLSVLASFLALHSTSSAQLYGRANQGGAYAGTQEGYAPESIIIILDASDSMNEKVGGVSKIQAAKDTVLKTLQTLPPNVNVGLRVYGHRRGSGGVVFSGPFGMMASSGSLCRQSQLLVPPGPNNRAQIASQLLNITAQGKTPISYSLAQAVRGDFGNTPGKKTIILVSDGRETCDEDPCDYALDMVRSGIQVKVNTIGFSTQDPVADDQLRCVAMSTKGRFYTANTAAELAKSLQDSLNVQTSVNAKIYPSP